MDGTEDGTTNSIYLVITPAVLPSLVCSLPNFREGVVHDGNQEVDHDDGHDDLVERPAHQEDGMREPVRCFPCTVVLDMHSGLIFGTEHIPEKSVE